MNKRIISGLLALSLVFGGAAVLPANVTFLNTALTASADVEKEYGNFKYQVIRGGKEIQITGLVSDLVNEIKVPGEIDGLPVTEIGNNAFYNEAHEVSNTIKKASLPDSIQVIGDSAFAYNEALTQLNMPKSLKTIGESAFEGCKNLGSCVLPDGVTSIGKNAFYWCEKTAVVQIPASVTSIGETAFYNCGTKVDNGKNFYIKCYFNTAAENYAFDNYIAYELLDEDKATTLTDGAIYNKLFRYKLINDGKEICITKGKISEETVEVPAKIGDIPVTEIGDAAFYNFEHKDKNMVKKIVLPDTIKKIDKSAFADNEKLTDINIPSSVTSIGDNAFEVCTSLEKITLPENLKTIGAQAFIHNKSLTNVTIPASVTTIGDKAFAYCGTITGNENFFIYCTAGTAGEKYAIDNKIDHSTQSAGVSKGDVNADGKINAADITKIAAHIKGLKTLDGSQKSAADVNSDGKINSADITKIAAHIKGIKTLR